MILLQVKLDKNIYIYIYIYICNYNKHFELIYQQLHYRLVRLFYGFNRYIIYIIIIIPITHIYIYIYR